MNDRTHADANNPGVTIADEDQQGSPKKGFSGQQEPPKKDAESKGQQENQKTGKR